MQWAKRKHTGFTIVELLIVVVVIAILAAITTVAYNGITRRAAEAVTQSALSTAQKKIATYAVENAGVYPASLSDIDLVSDDSMTYQYSVNNTSDPEGYCITATANEISSYFCKTYDYVAGSGAQSADTTTPTVGVAPGHSSTGQSITNLVTNPSVEVSTSTYSGPNSTAILQDSTRAYSGTYSVRGTMTIGTAVTRGVRFFTLSEVTTDLEPNTAYVASAWVWVPIGTVDMRLSIQGAGKASTAGYSQGNTALKNQWVRLYESFTTSSSGSVSVYVLNMDATTVAGTQFWADGFMITEGTQPATLATGASSGWVWNGTAELSTSTGPAL